MIAGRFPSGGSQGTLLMMQSEDSGLWSYASVSIVVEGPMPAGDYNLAETPQVLV